MTGTDVPLRMPWFEESWIVGAPDWRRLWRLADAQGGFFTNDDARTCGVRRSLLSYYARRDVFRRHARGLYRLPWCVPTPLDAIRVAWMTAGRDRSVVSHASALFLHGLVDAESRCIHLTLPRSRRGKIRRWEPAPWSPFREPPPSSTERAPVRRVIRHVPRQAVPPEDVTERHGIRVTTPPRSLIDTACLLHDAEILSDALLRALERGVVSRSWVRDRGRELGGMARRRLAATAPRGPVVGPGRGL